MLGNEFFSLKRGIRSITRLIRSALPYRVAKFIEDNGEKRIESITLYRSPITSVIRKLLSILSLGRWDNAQSKLGYDDLFHLYAVIQFSDDSRAILEKNQDINISDEIRNRGDGVESMPVDMKGTAGGKTLNELLRNTQRGMGSRFYPYDFRTNNCQDFLIAVLRYNGLESAMTTAFIKQPVDQLVKTLPDSVTQYASLGTKIASYTNRVLQSLGFKGFAHGGMVTF
jgi:hypothetical protein